MDETFRDPHDAPFDLKTILDKLKKNLACLICSDSMTVPFLLACGHVFCYTCLYEWLRSHKTCPTCRAKVERKPTIVYPMKEMSESLSAYQELLHSHDERVLLRQRKFQQEVFYKENQSDPFPFIHEFDINVHGGRLADPEEHVMRCIRCHWEVEGPECIHCGFTFGDDDNISEHGINLQDDSDLTESEEDLGTNEYDFEDSFIDPRDTSDIANEELEDASDSLEFDYDMTSEHRNDSSVTDSDAELENESILEGTHIATGRTLMQRRSRHGAQIRNTRSMPHHINISSDESESPDESGDMVRSRRLDETTWGIEGSPSRGRLNPSLANMNSLDQHDSSVQILEDIGSPEEEEFLGFDDPSDRVSAQSEHSSSSRSDNGPVRKPNRSIRYIIDSDDD